MNFIKEALAGTALGLILTVILAIASIPVACAYILWKVVASL